jgi:hypothetical protein
MDPAIIAPEVGLDTDETSSALRTSASTTSEDVRVAFGE